MHSSREMHRHAGLESCFVNCHLGLVSASACLGTPLHITAGTVNACANYNIGKLFKFNKM